MSNVSIFDLATAGVQSLVPYQPGKPISELQRELGLDAIIKLASNENPLGPSPKALAAIQKTLPELALYPDSSGYDLKNALAQKLQVKSEQITLGNGSNEILELLARTFLTPDTEVIFSQHAFAVYPIVTQAVGACAKIVPAVDYGHDLTAMLKTVSANTRMVFIANPNNPTGTYLNAAELSAFVQALPEQVICVLDEAYFEFAAAAADYPDTLQWLARHPNLVITRTFSKAYGLAGLRIGYSISGEMIAELLNRVRQPFNINMLALAAVQAALDDSEHLQRTLANNRDGLQQLTEGFAALELEWIPSLGNFVSVHLHRPGLPVYEALLRKGVIVRPVANYEMPQHLRISVGTARENQIFLNALKDVL
ncbi:MAG: histidinol-phosphate transaminase [Gammaproteobacteria bacterium]